MPEKAKRSADIVALTDDIGQIACFELVAGMRDEKFLVTPDTHHGRIQIRKQFAQLIERRIDDRAVLQTFDRHHHDRIVGETHRIGCPRKRDPAQHDLADLDFRRNDDVDRHVIAGKEVRPVRTQIALRADTGDLGRHVEQRMRHLTGHHVDLVIERHRDDHVRLLGTGLRQHVGMGAMAHIAAHVERIANALDEIGRGIYDRNVVFFRRKALGNTVADPARSADDDFHSLTPAKIPWTRLNARPAFPALYAKRFQFAMQSRAFHPDIFRGL